MTVRSYANAAPQLTLNASITAGATSLVVAGAFTGWPSAFPFFAILEYGTINMEIVSVTAITGSTATVVRGQDGSAAVSHNAGSTVNHGVVRQDVQEANAHVNASSAVHGVSGALVGTTDTQTLSNKTLTAPVVNNPTIVSPTVTGTTAGASANYSGSLFGGSITSGGSITAGGDSPVTGVVLPKAYANAAARDAALTSPTAGMVVFLTTPGLETYYNGSSWFQVGTATDTGWLTTGITATLGNYGSLAYRFRVLNGVCFLQVTANRTGGNITATSTGALGAGSPVVTLNSGGFIAPAATIHAAYLDTTTGSSGIASLDTTGKVTLLSGTPSQAISTGDTVTVTFPVYPIN